MAIRAFSAGSLGAGYRFYPALGFQASKVCGAPDEQRGVRFTHGQASSMAADWISSMVDAAAVFAANSLMFGLPITAFTAATTA